MFTVFATADENLPQRSSALKYTDVIELVSAKFDISNIEENVKSKINNLFKKYSRARAKYNANKVPINWESIKTSGSDEIVFSLSRKYAESNRKGRKRSLDELDSRKQIMRRTEEIWTEVCKVADEEHVTVPQLLGLLLTRTADKEARTIGQKLWCQGNSDEHKLSEETSLVIYNDSKLGRSTYTTQKMMMAAAGFNILPAWRHLRAKQASITPQLHQLPAPFTGVYANIIDAVRITVGRILESIPRINVKSDLLVDCKFGFDGSGGHSIHHQTNNDETNNLIITVFCPLEIKDSDGMVVWTEFS